MGGADSRRSGAGRLGARLRPASAALPSEGEGHRRCGGLPFHARRGPYHRPVHRHLRRVDGGGGRSGGRPAPNLAVGCTGIVVFTTLVASTAYGV